jgi:hypothetical protein
MNIKGSNTLIIRRKNNPNKVKMINSSSMIMINDLNPYHSTIAIRDNKTIKIINKAFHIEFFKSFKRMHSIKHDKEET